MYVGNGKNINEIYRIEQAFKDGNWELFQRKWAPPHALCALARNRNFLKVSAYETRKLFLVIDVFWYFWRDMKRKYLVWFHTKRQAPTVLAAQPPHPRTAPRRRTTRTGEERQTHKLKTSDWNKFHLYSLMWLKLLYAAAILKQRAAKYTERKKKDNFVMNLSAARRSEENRPTLFKWRQKWSKVKVAYTNCRELSNDSAHAQLCTAFRKKLKW